MRTVLAKGIKSGLLSIVLLGAGCSRMANVVITRTVTVAGADDICKKSVEVHLVGVNRFEKDQWEGMSMTKYWEPENKLRRSAKDYTYVVRFGQGPCDNLLGKKDPIRSVWKKRKAEYLLVLADLPGIFPDLPGNADARRLRLPALNSPCWGWRQTKINIAIEGSNIVPLTIPDSKCE
ncbi:MAG: hypothetical protein ACYSUP_00160 [Planctomycetota bacterium]